MQTVSPTLPACALATLLTTEQKGGPLYGGLGSRLNHGLGKPAVTVGRY